MMAGQEETTERLKKSERRCILTRDVLPKIRMVRYVEAPDGTIVPDVAAKLPGRGLWVTADGKRLDEALKKGELYGAVSRALKKKVSKGAIPSDIREQTVRLLRRRVLDRLGLEQRAGSLMTGFDKIKAALKKAGTGVPVLLFTASDGGEDGRQKMRMVVGKDVRHSVCFNRDQLSSALGKDNAVHAVVFDGGGADVLKADLDRLEGMDG